MKEGPKNIGISSAAPKDNCVVMAGVMREELALYGGASTGHILISKPEIQ